MAIQDMDRGIVQQILLQLEQALFNHLQWHNNLIRTIACRLPSDKHDILPNAYEECRFGQWCYSISTKKLVDNLAFQGILDAHKVMHELATNLLLNLDAHDSITSSDYDIFSNALEKLRLEISSLKNELENILYTRDPLTMTINRANMLPLLREQHDLVMRHFTSCCLVMMDVDLFKLVNDEHGHAIGDKVLVSLARYIVENLRSYDKVFRYGGEEFLICMPQLDLQQSFKVIDHLRENIAKISLDVGPEKSISVTASFGITLLDANCSVEEAIDRADKALYISKSFGKNNVHVWEADARSDTK